MTIEAPGSFDSDRTPEDARITLSYLNAPESADYIAVMDVLEASINDLSPVQVASALGASGCFLSADVVEHRLEKLREWRAITGTQDTSRILRHSDLLLRNRRYALTQAGRQVHRFYRTVLAVTVTLREIPLASMNRIVRSLDTIRSNPTLAPDEIAEHIRQVFVSHDDLDAALVGAEDGLTGLADRFDLDSDSTLELKTLLVEYTTRIANELSESSDIVAGLLGDLENRFEELTRWSVEASDARVLIERGALTASKGGNVGDWEGLQSWFDPYNGRAERFSMRLVRALPSMHSNLRRLHTSGGTATSRSRALSLAKACRDTTHGPAIAVAVLGDHSWRKLYGSSDDGDLPGIPKWAVGPHVVVPQMLRLSGRSGARGRAPAARDDASARDVVQARRERRAIEHEVAVREVLDAPPGAALSAGAVTVALATLMAAARQGPNHDRRSATKDGLACTIVYLGTSGDAPALRGPLFTIWMPGRRVIFHHPNVRPTLAGTHDSDASHRDASLDGPSSSGGRRNHRMSDATTSALPRQLRHWVPEANDDAAAALRALAARPWLFVGRDDDLIAAVRRNMPAVKDALNRLGWALVIDDREFIRLRKSAPQRAHAFAAGGPSPLAWSWFFLLVAAGESMQRRVSIGQLVAAARAATAEASLDAPGDITERRAIVATLKLLDARGVIVALDGDIDGFVHDEASPILLEVHHTRLLNVIANFASADPVDDPKAFLDLLCREPDIGRKIRRRLVDDTAVYVADLDADETAWLRRRSRDDLEPLADAFGLHLERRAEGAAFVAPDGSYRHLKELGPLAFPSSGTVGHAALLLADHANTHGRSDASTEASLPGWIAVTDDTVGAFLTEAAAHQSAGTGGWSRELAEDPTGLLRPAVRDMLEAIDIVRVTDVTSGPASEEVSVTVWWFAPLIGRWEQSLEAPVRRVRSPQHAHMVETLALTVVDDVAWTDSL